MATRSRYRQSVRRGARSTSQGNRIQCSNSGSCSQFEIDGYLLVLPRVQSRGMSSRWSGILCKSCFWRRGCIFVVVRDKRGRRPLCQGCRTKRRMRRLGLWLRLLCLRRGWERILRFHLLLRRCTDLARICWLGKILTSSNRELILQSREKERQDP